MTTRQLIAAMVCTAVLSTTATAVTLELVRPATADAGADSAVLRRIDTKLGTIRTALTASYGVLGKLGQIEDHGYKTRRDLAIMCRIWAGDQRYLCPTGAG